MTPEYQKHIVHGSEAQYVWPLLLYTNATLHVPIFQIAIYTHLKLYSSGKFSDFFCTWKVAKKWNGTHFTVVTITTSGAVALFT